MKIVPSSGAENDISQLFDPLHHIPVGPVLQGDITPALKATRDAVTDIMRGVLAKVTQFSRNGSADIEHGKRQHNGSSSSSSSNGHSHNSTDGNSDDVILQLNKEKTILERRIRLLEEEKERSNALAYKTDNPSSSSSSSVSGYKFFLFVFLVALPFIF